jgi:hypothetical protein
MNLGTIHNK